MKKTVLTVATALLLMATASVEANHDQRETNAVTVTALAKAELSSFCKAIMKGELETVKKLINLGEDVNKKSLGMTPAIFAARYNKAEILELLIENGADLKKRCNKGWSIEKHAKLSNAQDVLAVLNAQT
ncbi:MAG: hypothetical protein Mars2KO_40990 [Maribacter sp.]|uniref:ankyrin repeat domain-containing protein n=1 Tax=Maribacter sp. 2307UL18-2 TaxID=3386274 RepID=UPI0039BC2823